MLTSSRERLASHNVDLRHRHNFQHIRNSDSNGYKLNSHLTCFQQGFVAQSVEHRTGIVEVMGSNPVGASELFLCFICNSLSYFITARITFSCILYPQCTHVILSYTHLVIFETLTQMIVRLNNMRRNSRFPSCLLSLFQSESW